MWAHILKRGRADKDGWQISQDAHGGVDGFILENRLKYLHLLNKQESFAHA